MENENDYRKYYLRDDNLFIQSIPEDMELAFLLQHIQPDDEDTYKKLINRYASSLYLWIEILLAYYQPSLAVPEKILYILAEVFTTALTHVDQFHGQVSVEDWLFGLTYSIVKKKNGVLQQVLNASANMVNNEPENIYDKSSSEFWQRLKNLPDRLFLPIVLWYAFGLRISDVARIFSIERNEAYKRIILGRNRLREKLEKSHKNDQIQAYLDCIMDEDHGELRKLEQHISECNECQNALMRLKELEINLTEEIKARWKIPTLSDKTLEELFWSSRIKLNQPIKESKIPTIFQYAIWLAGFSAVFLILAFLFVRITPVEREFSTPQPTSIPTQVLPPIIEIQPAAHPSPPNDNSSIAPRYVEPDFSRDGNWIVYSSIKADPVSGLLLLPTVQLFDRSTNTSKLIYQSEGTLGIQWSGWDLAPSISSDGRWITYVGSIDTPIGNGIPCQSLLNNGCLGIFLYDRETDSSRQITQAWDGGIANGTSLSPAISGDGAWVAFWSTADNLIKDDEISCQSENTVIDCLFIYLYKHETGVFERIPIQTTFGDRGIVTGPISLTDDGRFVGFTMSIKSLPTYPGTITGSVYEILGNSVIRTQQYQDYDYSNSTTEAIVYDRETGIAELENRAPDGNIGNGASNSPVLSADGRFVAFASGSTNLVEGDTNDAIDVFVRDRESGQIELISVNTAGEQGNGNSGYTRWRRDYNSLEISSDGRYIVFESTAPNLGQRLTTDCYYYQNNDCILLYVRDRQTKHTELITELRNGDFLRFPGISTDGRWISFMQPKFRCSSVQDFCSNLMLYDLENNWMSNLTNYGEIIPSLPWEYRGSWAIPWELWESKALAFSTDGRFLAMGGMDSKIRIWQVGIGNATIIDNVPVHILDSGKDDTFSKIVFSPNGNWLTAGTTSGIVYIWKLPEGNLLYTLNENHGLIKDLVYTNHCAQLVILTTEKTYVWQIKDNQLIHDNNHTFDAAIDFSPLGNLLALDKGNGSIWLQQITDEEVIARLSNGSIKIRDVVFSEDGSWLAVRLYNGTINLWKIDRSEPDKFTFTPVRSFNSGDTNGSLAFSPDNKFITSSGSFAEVLMWSVPDGKLFGLSASFPNGVVNSMVFSKIGDRLAVVQEDIIILWEISPINSSKFYQQSQKDNFVVTERLPQSTAYDIPQLIARDKIVFGGSADLDKVEYMVDFPLLIPPLLPDYINFKEAVVYTDGSICLRYDVQHQQELTSSLYICEKLVGNSKPLTMTVGKSADVVPIRIETISGQKSAEYVQGDWRISQSFTQPASNVPFGEVHNVWNWDSNSASQRLRWVQYGILISLYYQANDPLTSLLSFSNMIELQSSTLSQLNQMDFVQIASAMRMYGEVKTEYFSNAGEQTSYLVFPDGAFISQ